MDGDFLVEDGVITGFRAFFLAKQEREPIRKEASGGKILLLSLWVNVRSKWEDVPLQVRKTKGTRVVLLSRFWGLIISMASWKRFMWRG